MIMILRLTLWFRICRLSRRPSCLACWLLGCSVMRLGFDGSWVCEGLMVGYLMCLGLVWYLEFAR